MATVVMVRDDVTGRFCGPEDKTHEVIISGKMYEIDLTSASFVKHLRPIKENGHPVGAEREDAAEPFLRDSVNGQFVSATAERRVSIDGEEFEVLLGADSVRTLLEPISKNGRLVDATF